MIWLKYIVPLLLWTCVNSQNVCEEPPEIDFGETVSGEKVKYQTGNRVQYGCFPGYALEGPEWITCKGPDWTPAPKCLAPCSITKQQLKAKNLFLSGGQRHSLAVGNNQTLGFLCKEGYVLSAPSVRRCIDGHMDLPSCISERGKNCSRSPTIENGDITTLSQEQYTSGSSVEFKCQQYYAMEGPSRSFCDNGNWTKVPVCLEPCVILLAETRRQNINMKLRSNEDEFQTVYLPRGDSIEFNCKPGHVLATNPSQSVFAFHCRGGPIVYPECKEVVCSRPEVNNGRVSPHRQQYSYEETIQIQCDPGYEPEQRQATSQCTKNGWRPQPKCVSKRCDYPEDELIELNGYSRRYSYYYFPRREGTSIEVRCKSGFLPANKQDWQRSMCTKFGWDPEPKCFKQCEHRGGFPHGRFHNTWNKFIEGNEILFSCDTGYYPEQQEAKAKCTKNGWSPTPRCISRDASCGNPPSITNGGPRNGTQGRYLPGTKVEYYCSEGFVIVGRFSTCRNRSWTRGPTCKEKPCGPPPQVFDASLVKRVKNSYVPGERVHYVCHPGFAANGPLEVACRKGQWTQPPTCEEIVCGDPPTVANADIISGRSEAYKSNHQVQYGCRKGFEMSGSHTVICGFKMWSEPPTCEDVTCPPPNEIDHGGIAGHPKERYMPFDTVRYQCDSGWSLSGPVVVTCIRKQWTNLPRCIDPERNCGRPPVIQNGDVLDPVRALYPPGTTLQYKCQNLYLMNGSSEVRCANGLWTEPPTCIEACIVSEEDMTRNNIQLKWKHAPKIYSASGDVVEFMCRWGYQPARSSPPFRTHCINGRVEYPRCV